MNKPEKYDAARYKRVLGALGLILANEFKDGESVFHLASRYSLDVEDVEDCLRHMMRSLSV